MCEHLEIWFPRSWLGKEFKDIQLGMWNLKCEEMSDDQGFDKEFRFHFKGIENLDKF